MVEGEGSDIQSSVSLVNMFSFSHFWLTYIIKSGQLCSMSIELQMRLHTWWVRIIVRECDRAVRKLLFDLGGRPGRSSGARDSS